MFLIIGVYSFDHISAELVALEKNREFLEKYKENKKKGKLMKELVKIEESDNDEKEVKAVVKRKKNKKKAAHKSY